MSEDTHICGVCKSQFHNLKSFIEHKKTCMKASSIENTSLQTNIKSDTTGDPETANCSSDVSNELKPRTMHDVLGGNTSHAIILQQNPSSLNPAVVPSDSVLKTKGSLLIRKGGTYTFHDIITLPHNTTAGSSTTTPTIISLNQNPKIVLNNGVFGSPAENPVLLTVQNEQPLPSDQHQALSNIPTALSLGPDVNTVIHKVKPLQKDGQVLEIVSQFKEVGSGTEKTVLPRKEDDEILQKTSIDALISHKLIDNIDEESILEQPMDLSGTGDVGLSDVSSNLKVLCGFDETMPVLQEECEISQVLQSVPVQVVRSHTIDTVKLPGDKKSVSPNVKNSPKDPTNKTLPAILKDKSPKILTAYPKNFKCSKCTMAFACRKDLDRHFRMHTGDKPFGCQYCPKKFSRGDKRKIHERTHTGDKPYKCDKCPYATTDSTNLKKHNFIHTGEKPFSCQICEYRCRNSNQLTVHIRTHTGDAPYVCYICKYAFKIKSDLTRHLFIHSGQKPFSCNYCDYKCTIKSNLKSHIRTNHDPGNMQACKKCDFKTSSKKNYLQHLAASHYSLKCPRCSFVAKDDSDLQLHSKIHLGQKTYQCSMCSFSSDRAHSVKLHVLKKHPKQMKPVVTRGPTGKKQVPKEVDKRLKQLPAQCKKKFQCPKCEAAFVREDSLCCHLRNHNETDKIVAMAVLDLQNPPVLSGVSAADNSTGTTSGMSLQNNINSPETVHIDVNVYLNNAVPNVTNDSVQSKPENIANLIVNNTTINSSINCTKTQDNALQYSSAVLSQAASNLLAFMQNNQNKAVEENMSNMARQMAVSSGTSHSQTVANNRSVLINRPVSQQHVVTSLTNIPTRQIISDNPGSLSTQVQLSKFSTQDTDVIDAVGNMEFNQASTSIISNNCGSHVDHSGVSSGQSNWEHLQRAVLQSVSLQSDDEDDMEDGDIDETTPINTEDAGDLYTTDKTNLCDNNCNSVYTHSITHSSNNHKYTFAHSSQTNESNIIFSHPNNNTSDSSAIYHNKSDRTIECHVESGLSGCNSQESMYLEDEVICEQSDIEPEYREQQNKTSRMNVLAPNQAEELLNIQSTAGKDNPTVTTSTN